MYTDNDELGVAEYDEDMKYIFDAHKILVRHISENQEANNEYLQGDFLGIRTKTFKDENVYKYIAISSNTRNKKEKTRDGFTSSGIETYQAIAMKDTQIKHNDTIIMNDKRYTVYFDSTAAFKELTTFYKFELRFEG